MKAITPQKFLQAIFRKDPEGAVMVGRPKVSGGWHHARPDDDAFVTWCGSEKPVDWYFSIAAVKPRQWLRRRGEDFIACYCVVLDDIGTKSSSDGLPAPAWVMETSPGNHQWGYILEEPCRDPDTVSAWMRGLHEAGFTDGGAIDATHMFRLPGSANKKDGRDNFRSTVLDWHPRRRISLEDFEACGVQPVYKKARRARVAVDVLDGPVDDALLSWMVREGLVLDDKDDLVVVSCPWAEEHTDGTAEAAYFPLGRGSGEQVMIRGFKCMHEHCADRSFRDWMRWCRDRGAPECVGHDPLPWLQGRYGLVSGSGQPVMVDLLGRGGPIWRYSLQSAAVLPGFYGRMFAPGRDRPITVLSAWKESPDTQRFNDFIYQPGAGAVIDTALGAFVNTWVPLVHKETDVQPTAFLEHVERLCGDHAELFLQWLAYKIQYPGERSFCVMMVTNGTQGVGRGILGDALSAVWGDQAYTTDLAQLLGMGSSQNRNWNSWMSETQLALVEEAKDVMSREDGWHAYEQFKQRVDTKAVRVGIRRKGLDERREQIWFNTLVFSNHLDALVIPPEERRIMVIRNPDEPMVPAEGRRVAEHIEDETAAIYWYLKRLDVSNFDAADAPITAAKTHMIEASVSPRELIMEWILQHAKGECITRKQFRFYYELACAEEDVSQGTKTTSFHKLWTGLVHISDAEKGLELRVGGTKERVKALKNGLYWRNVYTSEGADLVKREVERNTGGTGATV